MEQGSFDFDDFQARVQKRREDEVLEAQEGLKLLDAEREKLEVEREAINARIKVITEKIESLQSFLGGEEKQEKEKERGASRDRGVLLVLRQIVNSDWEDIDFSRPQQLEDIVRSVRKVKPTAREDTIRSGLLRLVKTKVLEVHGKRGNREWILAGLMDDDESSDSKSDNESSDSKSDNESSGLVVMDGTEVEKPKSHNEIVAGVRERIVEELEKSKDGLNAKNIAYIMQKTGSDEIHFEAAVNLLQSEGLVEIAKSLKDDSHVIRKPVDPDSKEGLKRIRVEGKSLFPNMDQPNHA